jgi:hypothetical protein
MGGLSISGDGFTRTPPFQHPDNPQMYCMGVPDIRGIKPYVDETGWLRYRLGQVTATFGVPTWQYFDNDPSGNNDPSGQAWTRTKFRESAEVFQPPFGSFFIGPFTGGTGTLINEATIGVVRPRVEISMSRLLVAMIPLNDSMDLIGTVNDETIQFGDYVFKRSPK